MSATKRQLSKIWAAARELDLERDELYRLVYRVTDKHSMSENFTFTDAGRVIDRLVQLGATPGDPTAKKKPSGKPAARGEIKLIRPDQVSLIEDLRAQLGGDWLRDEYFEGACKKLLRGQPRARTLSQAVRVIEMLKRRRDYNATKAQ